MNNNQQSSPEAKKSDLLPRTLSSLVLAPIAVWLIWLGGLPFQLLILTIAVIASYEWSKMCKSPSPRISAIALIAVMIAIIIDSYFVSKEVSLLYFVFMIALISCFGVFLSLPQLGRYVVGAIYIGLGCLSLIFLRAEGDPDGLFYVGSLFLCVWSTDIFAYFTGRTFGGPKLAPKLSPKKTWSGLLGGMLASALALTLSNYFYYEYYLEAPIFGWLGYIVCFVIGALIAVFAQIGDLFESWAKRQAGVKDSGHLIPGHGGILDRVDGLLSGAIAAYVLFELLIYFNLTA